MSLQVETVADIDAMAVKSLAYMQGSRIAVSGGSTFAALFPLWRESVIQRLARGEALRFYPVDERMVGYDEPGCNWKVCVDLLLGPAGLGIQRNHHVSSVQGFKDLLAKDLQPEGCFDTIYLGMGTDGHTASLFPGGAHLSDVTSEVLQTVSPKPPLNRLTLGFKALWRAKHLIAIITGNDKAEMVQRLLRGDSSLPIVLALQGHPAPRVILDAAAAGKL